MLFPQVFLVLWAPQLARVRGQARQPSKAPLPAPDPPSAMAPPAAPRPAPTSPPRAPGLAIRQARSLPVAHCEDVEATGIARGVFTVVRLTAGTTRAATSAWARRTGVVA